MRDFLISVASGLVVAILSAVFLRRPLPKAGTSQSMTMNGERNRGVVRFLLVFLFSGALVLAAVLLMNERRFF